MIEADRQAAVLTLYRQGVGKKSIAESLRLDVKTVRGIIRRGSVAAMRPRSDRARVDDELLLKLYEDCKGYVERMHEILTEQHGVKIGYSTLTRLVRSRGLDGEQSNRAAHVPDVAGEEMQHDTTVYKLKIGTTTQRVICSGLYLRYSKMRYIRFYRFFNRFQMKCFLDEALRYWGFCAKICIIDNTNLAILHGSGSNAVFHPEMIAFARNYGFSWKAHAIGHANRKAGKERNFWTVETNFLPGRSFASLHDLNEQARAWATQRYAQRPQSKTKLVPVQLFETEKPLLVKLPDFISAPYQQHQRRIDEYGYITFDVNYYWIPPKSVSTATVTVLQYADHLRIMDGIREILRYQLPTDEVKNRLFVPAGVDTRPRGKPRNRKQGCEHEEGLLRHMPAPVGEYLDMVTAPQSAVRYRGSFIRSLYQLSQRLGPLLFTATIQRALCYRVSDLDALERIAHMFVTTPSHEAAVSFTVPSQYQQRPAYQQGRFSEENTASFDSPSQQQAE
jgi:transposase